MLIGKLIVRAYRAEGLAAADINGKSDPFIKMHLVNQFHRTSTQYKTLNPEWNEMFVFNIYDINNYVDFLVYDEDRHGEDFLGRIIVPLLSVKHKKMVWYQLKNKKLQATAKGRVLLRMDIEWSILKACIRTFNPLEELKDPPAPVIRKSLMVSNFMRAKAQIMTLVSVLLYIKSCFQWESKLRSLCAFALFVVVTLYFELWMLPLSLLSLFSLNLAIINSPRARRLFGLDEFKYRTLEDIRFMINSDVDTAEDIDKQLQDLQINSSREAHIVSSTTNSAINSNSIDQEEDKTIVERIQAGRDVVILIQDITGGVASYLERVSNMLTFKVPFLSYLMMSCLLVATLLLYCVPLRYIILAWGINKFTKKLRNPLAIDNNELIDYLSRVPDDVFCVKAQNVISF